MNTSTSPVPAAPRSLATSGHVPRRVFHFLYAFLAIAILLNGSYFWLQKSQVMPNSDYIEYLQELNEYWELYAQGVYVSPPKLDLNGFYATPGKWILTKVAKDAFCLVAIIVALLAWWRSSPRPPIPPRSSGSMLLVLLVLSLGIAAVISITEFGVATTAMGLRPFAYVAAGLLVTWAMGQQSLEMLRRYLIAIVLIELALGCYEFAFGIPFYNSARITNRIAGTFSHPSSLGIFAVCTCALAISFWRAYRWWVLIPVAALVYFSGSATALVLLAVLVGVWAVISAPIAWRPVIRVSSLGVVAILFLAMPKLVERYDVMDSLWSRVDAVRLYTDHLPSPLAVLFGKGLGFGSNAFISSKITTTGVSAEETAAMFNVRADSTPVALVNQIGVVGVALFYLLMALAAWRDRDAVPVYAVLFLASLTMNLLELFPVNFVLGLLLAQSLLLADTEREQTGRIGNGRSRIRNALS